MAVIISSNNIVEHNVDKYNFKVLSSAKGQESNHVEQKGEVFTPENNPKQRASDVDSSALSQSSKDSLIESLMKKTDDMSSNFIKLQMKLEAKEEEYAASLQKAKEQAYQEGVSAGTQQAKVANEATTVQMMNQLSASIATLQKSAQEFHTALENIKNDLMSAALDIAKEVVNVELRENSQNIAASLAKELIQELQSASKITLKVNPKNHGTLSESLGKLEHINIVSDSAVSEGGVIALSDAGNIDAQVSKRFERVKRAVLSE